VTLSEPDVALTDFGLAVECAVFAAWLYWRAAAGGPVRTWWIVFFCALGGGALLGGITHGLLVDHDSVSARALWSATLVAIGLAALACWAIGGLLLFPARAPKLLMIAAGSLFAAYAVTVVFLNPSFAVAVAHYGLAGAFLLAAFLVIYRRRRERHVLSAIAGLVLSFAAAAVQQSEVAVPALNLSHNALYHMMQAAALLLIFLAAQALTREDPACPHGVNS
jgi:hypothetical protein